MTDLQITRRTLLASLPAIAAIPLAAQAQAQAPEPRLSFLAVGDWGRDGASHQRDVAAQMARSATAARSRLIVSTGDNFYEDGVQSATDPQWRTSFEDVYADPALQVPWYAVLGNHDYRGRPQAQLDYALASPRWRMPARYHVVAGATLGAPHVDLFFLDTSPLVQQYRRDVHSVIAANVATQDVPAQLAWLDAALAESAAPWKLVFGHHTIFSGGSDHGNTPEMVALVRPILERRGVQAYFNGHEHDLQHLRIGPVDYICSGAGSSVRPTGSIAGTRFALSRSGFASCTVSGDTLDLEFRDYQGVAVYHAAIARAGRASG